ncbi:MAG: MOSC domain-containing protein [Anaerolineales bacterium]
MDQNAVVTSLMVLPVGAKIRSEPVAQVEVTKAGFAGDRHAGLTREAGSRDSNVPRGTVIRNTRQISIVAEEDLQTVAERLGVPEVKPQWLGSNMQLRGVPGLTKLEHGARLRFSGGVVLVVEGENKPCRTPGEVLAAEYPEAAEVAARFAKEALGLRGLVGWVEQPGQLTLGESVEIVRSDEAAGG